MRTLILVFALALLAAAAPLEATTPGAAAPPLVLPRADGRELALAELRGQVVYVDFWASWCGPCRKSFPWMNAMQRRYGARGLVVLAVNLDETRAEAERFLAETPAEFTVLYDAAGTSARSWRVKGMPSSYLVGADGKVQYVHAGFREEQRDELEQRIRQALPPD
ncbi:glutathione peroxidase [Burkholderiales bacterium]|nr:MAG: TlpA family protein disulfide reductase [Burkholderiales bacterium]CAG0959105.1 glutathione peroxidase [Burkholderiales bacterium]